MNDSQWDVIIIGGGPAGSTAASLLRKYDDKLKVLIVEKERFPRDHVGESQLPSISDVLHEMGVWDEVEAANFPVKIGASYTWGQNQDRWDFDFYPLESWQDETRPAKYEGQRTHTAFQVDRAIYDHILLKHAATLGAEVREETRVAEVLVEGDRVQGLRLADGSTIQARWYLDGSGGIGILRRALGVESDAPKELRNIAMWDYWENADWAVEIGSGTTRVQVRSLSYGWMWFIPLGPTRTSIGLICPASYYKQTGKRPEELYAQALEDQTEIRDLIKGATSRGEVESCSDWSHLSDRMVGENWMLIGESAGFADPILAAGMSLAHSSAREAAYSILELDRGELDAEWIRQRYDHRNRTNIQQHIRFAQFWYSANGCFTDLQEHCSAIAGEAGLKLDPKDAWRWLSQGGFTIETLGLPSAGSFDVASAKQVLQLFDQGTTQGKGSVDGSDWLVNGYNTFKLNLQGSRAGSVGDLKDGRINRVPCYVRDVDGVEKKLPNAGMYGEVIRLLRQTQDGATIMNSLVSSLQGKVAPELVNTMVSRILQAMDVLIQDGWIERSLTPGRPVLRVEHGGRYLRHATETDKALKKVGRSGLLKSNI